MMALSNYPPGFVWPAEPAAACDACEFIDECGWSRAECRERLGDPDREYDHRAAMGWE